MPSFTLTHLTTSLPQRRGYQKRALIHDASTGKPICQRIGGLRYAQPLDASQRWKRARPLPADLKYGMKNSPTDLTGLANECPQPNPDNARDILREDEDCLQMNIYVPLGTPPKEGWPVFFYIYGGFLQWGSPNLETPLSLYTHTSYNAIFVAPCYRLNAFGFLSSSELSSVSDGSISGNLGFWDQRLALEFTHSQISLYGGNPHNITVGGLSAGAYSTFHQLAYSLGLPADKGIIRRVVMWSNGCGLQPKSEKEVQGHFDALVAELGIEQSLSAGEKLAKMRAVSAKKIAKAVERVPINAFRAVADGKFVRDSLFAELHSGAFARKMRERGIKTMAGDVRDEINSYRVVAPPSSYVGLVQRLAVEYPDQAAERLGRIYCPDGKLPREYGSWQDLFGRIYADMQVHVTQRGLVECLVHLLPEEHVLRYRVEARAKCVDGIMKPEMKVAHGSDLGWWFWGQCFGMRGELTEKEVEVAKEFVEPFWRYIRGDEVVGWGPKRPEEVRKLVEGGGKVVVARDTLWEEDLRIWRKLHGMDKSRL